MRSGLTLQMFPTAKLSWQAQLHCLLATSTSCRTTSCLEDPTMSFGHRFSQQQRLMLFVANGVVCIVHVATAHASPQIQKLCTWHGMASLQKAT